MRKKTKMANICRGLRTKIFFSPVLKSPTHIGFTDVKKNGSKISHLGTFNSAHPLLTDWYFYTHLERIFFLYWLFERRIWQFKQVRNTSSFSLILYFLRLFACLPFSLFYQLFWRCLHCFNCLFFRILCILHPIKDLVYCSMHSSSHPSLDLLQDAFFILSQTYFTVPSILHPILGLVYCTMQSSAYPRLNLLCHVFLVLVYSTMHSSLNPRLGLLPNVHVTCILRPLQNLVYRLHGTVYCTVHSSPS